MATFLLECLALAFLPSLDHPNYQIRHRADRVLKALGRFAEPALRKGLSSPSGEVQQRCRRLYGVFRAEQTRRHAAELLPDGYPRHPWLTLGDSTEQEWLTLARKQVGYDANETCRTDWPEYRVATRLRVESWLLEGRSEREIIRELNRMRDCEINWIVEYGHRQKPQIDLPPGVVAPEIIP